MSDEVELACLVCDWAGEKEDATWHDLSGFHDDSMCDFQEGSGWWGCPECGEVCRPLEDE